MNRSEPLAVQPAESRKLSRPSGFKTASIAVGLNGEAIRLLVPGVYADALIGRTEQPGWASFPKTQTDIEYSAIVSISDGSITREVRLFGLTETFPKIDVLPEREILIVAPRCFRSGDGSHEPNATVYDRNGRQQRKFFLGDGIEHVQTDGNGNIWVGYSDEGVYGNFGWQSADARVGVAGLSCFSRRGQKMWDFQPPEGCDHISDCYALNVTNNGAWACYYTDFPIVFIDSDWRIRAWRTEITGGRALAVDRGKVLVYGGYREQRTRCSLLDLEGSSAQTVADVSLALPYHVDISSATVLGRGGDLHVFDDDTWYRFSSDSLERITSAF